MIIAALWPPGPEAEEGRARARSGEWKRAAGQAGRFVAAGGHTLLLDSPEGLSLLAGEAYREAGGPRLIGMFAEGAPEAPTDPFHETLADIPPNELPGRILERADALLFMAPPEIAWTAAAKRADKPLYAIAPLCGESPPTGLRLLPDMEAFARELAKLFSRSIVSRPDPMAARLRRREPQ